MKALRPLIAALALLGSGAGAADTDPLARLRARPPEDELIYFLLPDRFENGDPGNDRGGLSGPREVTGFDPAHKGFFQGGDLRGLTARLDYIQGLGATAIWLGPVFRNKPVQGPKGGESAGYHGYWVTDFTTVDPHFGTEAEFRALVDAAHWRGIKVYMDIIANHTADVILYRECAPCAYRSRADYPYQAKGGLAGPAINPGFAGDHVRTAENFARLTDPGYAYTPYVPAGEERVKQPGWLNDPRLYHNRGNSTFQGESSTMGDFAGLDDLMTEHPRVVAGMIEIYGSWIDRFGIDGFRIDTAQHVNPEFWAAFVPAMRARAAARGIPNFHIFGEIAFGEVDPGRSARHTRVDGLPSVLDFAFQTAIAETVAEGRPTARLARLFFGDPLYEGGAAAARALPTFLGNHDIGRFGWFVARANPGAAADELYRRTLLGHRMLLTLRGVPTIYAGDEQGYVGTGGDQDARAAMFPTRVAAQAREARLGTDRLVGDGGFDPAHPLYRDIAALARLRAAHPALRRGAQQLRHAEDNGPGLFAVSRFDPDTGREYVIAFNTATRPLTAAVAVETRSARFTPLLGDCPAAAARPGSILLTIAPLGSVICAAEGP
jgi:glycosidase